jgi:hypothetical protein
VTPETKILTSNVAFSIYKSFYILLKFNFKEECPFGYKGNLEPLLSLNVYPFSFFFHSCSHFDFPPLRLVSPHIPFSSSFHHSPALPFLLLVHPRFHPQLAPQHADNPSTPSKPSSPLPGPRFNLILSPAQLAQRSIITRFDQTTIP